MINLRKMEKAEAINERVELAFYSVTEKKGKKYMKPLPLHTSVPIAVVRAVLDNTIIDSFYQRLVKDLQDRGIPAGTTVQVRANFSRSDSIINPTFKRTHVICEVKV